MTNWFEIDRKGLSKLIERRGKAWLVYELISNAWDADGTTRVEVTLTPEEGKPKVWLTVTDDSPNGFADLRHAWTLFAESGRKGDAEKRGRFNLGEKLVLALCDEASIVTTTAGVMFDHCGRTMTKTRRPAGSEFSGLARITRAELVEIRQGLQLLIPPHGITTIIEGVELQYRAPLKRFFAVLMTDVVDEDDNIKRQPRKCGVSVYEPIAGPAMIYEMGIPVVETGDRWSVNISQKVPLNMDRDNVTPAYLRDVRTLVVNAMHDQLTETDANATFVNEALADANATAEAVEKALTLKYTDKRAIFDPSDREANMNLEAKGYRLIHGSQLTKQQWDNVKKYDGAKPSGQIMPTKVARLSVDGMDRRVPEEKWTPAMRRVVDYAIDMGRELLERDVHVAILSDITESYVACFGDQGLVFNLGRLGHAWFENAMTKLQHIDLTDGLPLWRPTPTLNQLLIHEFGHGMPGGTNHLSDEYHDGLCKLGAKLADLVLRQPSYFEQK